MSVRVLWVIKGLGPGGAETLLAAAARAHDRSRFHIECAYVLPWKDHLAGRLETAEVRTHCLSLKRTDRRWPIRLAKLIREGEWDVVHTHSPLPASVARLAVLSMHRNRPKLVTTEHNAWGTFGRATRVANRLTFGLNDAVFAVSEEARQSMTGSGAAKAVALRHGIDVPHTSSMATERAAVRDELDIGADEFVIGTVANFRAQKDYPNFLRAAHLLAKEQQVRFVVVGQGPLEADTRALAAELGVQDRVLFTGFRADAVRVMSAFDVFTLASSWEGLPVALMEASALGLPVVATAVGGVAEELADGTDAVLVPPKDAEALAAGWAKVMGDDKLRRTLAVASKEKAGAYDVSRAEQTIEQTYERLVGPIQRTSTKAMGARTKRAPALEIREATPDDREAILALLQRSMNRVDDPRFADLYRWKHDENPFGLSPTWVAVDGDRIAAVRALMRWEFVRGGEVLRAVRAVDTATDPDYQGKGLFTALTLHGLDQMKADGVAFVFNTPNSQSRPGYLKMGWREVGRLPVAVRLKSPLALPKLATSRVASSHWSETVTAGIAFTEWAAGRSFVPPASLSIRTLATHTTDAYFRWRFGLEPLSYRVLEHGGGAIVFRVRRRGEARELVHAASIGLGTDEADRALVSAINLTGTDHGLRLGSPNLRSGLMSLPGGGPVFTWRALNDTAMPPPSNWSLVMSDVELF